MILWWNPNYNIKPGKWIRKWDFKETMFSLKKKSAKIILISSWLSDLVFESLGLPSCWFFFGVIYWPQGAVTYRVHYHWFSFTFIPCEFFILLVLSGLPSPRCFLPCVKENYLFLLVSSPDCLRDMVASRWRRAKLGTVLGHVWVSPTQWRCRIWTVKGQLLGSHSAWTEQCPPREPL